MDSKPEYGHMDVTRNHFTLFLKKLAKQLVFLAVVWGVLFSFSHYNFSEFLPREWIVLAHIFASIIFLGNIIVSAVWMRSSGKTERASLINFASQRIIRSDLYFTQPGVFILIITGVILSLDLNGSKSPSWMIMGVALFALSGAVWGLFLRRYQNQMLKITEGHLDCENNIKQKNQLPKEFYPVFDRWNKWGIVAIALVLGSLVLMSIKPTLW